MFGDENEAFIENHLSDKINIIYSDDNQRGKTILIQAIFYCLGISKPAFPNGFEYNKYYYILTLEENNRIFEICRHNDIFIVKNDEKLFILESISELKRFWTKNIFEIPIISKNEKSIIVDPDLFYQLAFVGQDDKITSNLSNHAYYKKEDFYNLIYSFMHLKTNNLDDYFDVDEAREELKKLQSEKKRILKQHKIVSQKDNVINLISTENDRQQAIKTFEKINSLKKNIIEYKKTRNKLNIKIVKYETLEKELNSLNRELSVGHLECLDCHSRRIGYSSDQEFSFDVSTTDIRNSILGSIKDKIDSFHEELDKVDLLIENEQTELKKLLTVDDVSLELLLTVKDDIKEITDVDTSISEINKKIDALRKKIDEYNHQSQQDKEMTKSLLQAIVQEMNNAYQLIDKEGIQDFSDIFTSSTQIYSGSNVMLFYLIRFYAFKKILHHKLPIIIDSFRAEDLSTKKEKKTLLLYNQLPSQVIFTTTLKSEELGKYDEFDFINKINYSANPANKIMSSKYTESFLTELTSFNIIISETEN